MIVFDLTDYNGQRERVTVDQRRGVVERAPVPAVEPAPTGCVRCARLRRAGRVPAWLWLLPLTLILLLAMAVAVRP